MDNNTIVSLFLSEIIRSRNTSIPRAAEISDHVLKAMEKLRNDEAEMLRLLEELEKDFEDVAYKQTLHFGRRTDDIRVYEGEIRNYAADLFKKDMISSAAFLRDAARSQSINKLCQEHPDFYEYLESTDKAEMVKSFPLS